MTPKKLTSLCKIDSINQQNEDSNEDKSGLFHDCLIGAYSNLLLQLLPLKNILTTFWIER